MRANLLGKSFGNLVVKAFSHSAFRKGKNRGFWLCICTCGKERICETNNLTSGHSTSCGCRRIKSVRKKLFKHGLCGSPEYRVWQGMIARCNNPRKRNYRLYGARGIKVCLQWLDFRNFFRDMGNRPSFRHSIERINNDGNYEPDNVKWATPKEQARNQRNNHFLEAFGKRQTLSAWAEELGIRPATIWKRIRRGWSAGKTLTEPIKDNGFRK